MTGKRSLFGQVRFSRCRSCDNDVTCTAQEDRRARETDGPPNAMRTKAMVIPQILSQHIIGPHPACFCPATRAPLQPLPTDQSRDNEAGRSERNAHHVGDVECRWVA